MKIDEPFNPDIKSSAPPENIFFKLADRAHIRSINLLMSARNPLDKMEDIDKKTHKEISLNMTDPEYRLFVALLDNEVVGLCRLYNSRKLAPEKLKFEAPEGWYAMGTLVSSQYRRKGIAKFLSEERRKFLKSINVSTLYSMVDVENKTSLKMHQEFGFEEVARAKGFLHLDFPNSSAILFKLKI